MDFLLYFMRSLLIYFLDAIMLAMFVRGILSWFDPEGEWKISAFLIMVTEPFIIPVRAFCAKKNWFEGVPIDVPFMITFVLLMIIQTLVEIL